MHEVHKGHSHPPPAPTKLWNCYTSGMNIANSMRSLWRMGMWYKRRMVLISNRGLTIIVIVMQTLPFPWQRWLLKVLPLGKYHGHSYRLLRVPQFVKIKAWDRERDRREGGREGGREGEVQGIDRMSDRTALFSFFCWSISCDLVHAWDYNYQNKSDTANSCNLATAQTMGSCYLGYGHVS